jgi:hypothetical protein
MHIKIKVQMDVNLKYRLFCIYAFLFAGLWGALLYEQPLVDDGDDDLVYFAPLFLIGAIGVFSCFIITTSI